MTASHPDERPFEQYRDIEIAVDENGKFVLRRLPYSKTGQGSYPERLEFPTVRAARKAIDDDISKARAEAANQTIEVWTLAGDAPLKAVITGIHGGTGQPVAQRENGAGCEVGRYSSDQVFTTEEEAFEVARLERIVREANKRAVRARERLVLPITRVGRVGPEGAVKAFLALRAQVEEHRKGAPGRRVPGGVVPFAPVAPSLICRLTDAMGFVESAGASPAATDAVGAVGQARDILRAEAPEFGVGEMVVSVNDRSEALGFRGKVVKVESGQNVYVEDSEGPEKKILHFFAWELVSVGKVSKVDDD